LTLPALERGDRVANFVLADLAGAFRLFYDLTKGGPGLIALGDGADAATQRLLARLAADSGPFATLGCELFAVVIGAADRVAALAKAAAPGELPFPVFIDAEAKVNRVYPVAGESAGLKLVLIDPNQRVLASFAGAGPDPLVDAARDWLARHWRAAEPTPSGAPAPILMVPDAFDRALCDALIAAWRADHAELGVSGSTDALLYDKKKSQDHVVRDPDMNRRISQTLNRRIAPEVLKAFTFKGPYGFDGHIVLGYDAERRDFFGPHRDNMSPRTRHRRFAISLNLNDDFEGGELRFPEYGGALYRMASGTACVFSCSLLHEAVPVKKGRRFVLTTFMCDPAGPAPGGAGKA